MRRRRIGDIEVSAIGLGGMPLSVSGRPDREAAVVTIRSALDAEVTLIDTADAYSLGAGDFGHNESLIAEALHRHKRRSAVLVATKGGHTRGKDGSWALDGSPDYLRTACEGSLRRLNVDAIGLYQFHRPDPKVPFADSVGALRDLLDAGKIQYAGVSNVDPEQIRLANDILDDRLASVQNEFSPDFRSSEPELRLCDELGIAFLPWSPFGGSRRAADLGSAHPAFARVAERHGVSPQRVCLAWMLAKSPVLIPIPGARRPATIRDSAAAVDLRLTDVELAELDGAA